MDNKIIGYISDEYFHQRTMAELKDPSDPVMALLWDMVLKLVSAEETGVRYKYKYFSLNTEYEAVFIDPFTAYQWEGETYEEKAYNIVNYILHFCSECQKNDLGFSNRYADVATDKMHTKQAKKNIFGLSSALLKLLRVNIDKDITGVSEYYKSVTEYLDMNNHEPDMALTYAELCFNYLSEERNLNDFVVRDTFYYRKQLAQKAAKPKKKEERPVRTHGMGEKVTIAMLMKLESKLGISALTVSERAEIYSSITGFSKDKISQLLSGRIDLIEAYHLKDVEKANKLLLKMGIKRPIAIDRTSEKKRK